MISDILSALLKRATKIEEEIADLEEIAFQRKADLAQIMESDIPAVLHENGLLSAPLLDGRIISIDQVLSVSNKNKEALFAWLEANSYDAVIKTELDFGKGADMEEIEAYLRASGVDYSKNMDVHAMTLKKVMRDHLDAGGMMPDESVCKVSIFERARVKGGKD